MSPTDALPALIFVGDCFLAATVILAVTWLASSVMRKNASLRHLAWLVAFGALLILPILGAIVPPRVVQQPFAASPLADSFNPGISFPLLHPAKADNFSGPMEVHDDLRAGAVGIFAVWLTGIFWIAFQAFLGVLSIRAIRRRSAIHAFETVDLSKLAATMGLKRNWELRVSTMPDHHGPITWGFCKPVILLPKNSVLWSHDRLEAVLLHELAHVRRYDTATPLISLLVCAIYWPNPLVWICARFLRAQAEIATDDVVITSGVKPSAYAAELLRIAAEFRQKPSPFLGMKLSIAEHLGLEARINSILDPTQSRSGVTPMQSLKTVCLGLVAVALVAFLRPAVSIAAAQNAPSPGSAANSSIAADAPPQAANEDTIAPNASAPSKQRARIGEVEAQIGKAAEPKQAEAIKRTIRQAVPKIRETVALTMRQPAPNTGEAVVLDGPNNNNTADLPSEITAEIGKLLIAARAAAQVGDFETALDDTRQARAVSGATAFDVYRINQFLTFIALAMNDSAAADKAAEAAADSPAMPTQDKITVTRNALVLALATRHSTKAAHYAQTLKDSGVTDDKSLALIRQANRLGGKDMLIRQWCYPICQTTTYISAASAPPR